MNIVKIGLLLAVSCTARADIFEVENTGITFEAPEGFEPLPQEMIDFKWPNRNAPSFVVGNLRGTTTIAYDIKPRDLSNADMEELRAVFETTFNRIVPGIEWKKNEVIEHEGRDWVYLELTSNAIDTDIYNIMMMTAFEERMVIFNFNSTKEDFPGYEKALRESMRSISLPRGNDKR